MSATFRRAELCWDSKDRNKGNKGDLEIKMVTKCNKQQQQQQQNKKQKTDRQTLTQNKRLWRPYVYIQRKIWNVKHEGEDSFFVLRDKK